MDPAEQESLLELQRNTSSRSRRESADTSDYYRKFKMRLRYYIPIVGWLPKYTLESFQNDLTAGLTVASLIIPQSLSYAQALVRVPPVLGLVSAFITQFIYATLGTSRQLAVGPEALVSILVGSTIYEFRSWRDANPQLFGFDDEIDQYLNIQATALLCLLVGIFTLTVGIFRLGFLDSILSRALLRGFVLAVACVVMIDMSETMLGLIPPKNQCTDNNGLPSVNLTQAGLVEPSSPFQLLLQILSNLSNAHLLTSTISVCSVAFLFGARVLKAVFAKRKWVTLIPEILVLVVVTTLLTQFFRWDCQGLAILNDIQTSIPKNVETFPKPTSAKIKHLMLPSMLITVIGFVESIAVAKTYASRHGYGVSPNRELVAIGTGNIISSFFGGFPSFGSLGRSAVNDAAGSQTQMSGFITALAVLTTYLCLLPLFKFLPQAVCSSIIVVAALKLIEFEDIYFLVKIRAWGDIALLLLTFLSTVFISIETGTLISVGTSLMLVVKHTTTIRFVLLGKQKFFDPVMANTKEKYCEIKKSTSNVQRVSGLLIIRFEEGLFFGNVGQLTDKLKRIEMHGELGVHPGEDPRSFFVWDDETQVFEPSSVIKGVIFDMKAVSEMDATAANVLYEIIHEYKNRSIQVCFVKVRDSLAELFHRAGLLQLVEGNNYQKIHEAVAALSSQTRSPSVQESPSIESYDELLQYRQYSRNS